jgi:hypothetical protein
MNWRLAGKGAPWREKDAGFLVSALVRRGEICAREKNWRSYGISNKQVMSRNPVKDMLGKGIETLGHIADCVPPISEKGHDLVHLHPLSLQNFKQSSVQPKAI